MEARSSDDQIALVESGVLIKAFLSWGGEGLSGPISVTGRDVTLTGLSIHSRWPARKTLADLDSLHVSLASLEIGEIVTASARQEMGRVTALVAEGIELEVELGPFREGVTYSRAVREEAEPQAEPEPEPEPELEPEPEPEPTIEEQDVLDMPEDPSDFRLPPSGVVTGLPNVLERSDTRTLWMFFNESGFHDRSVGTENASPCAAPWLG